MCACVSECLRVCFYEGAVLNETKQMNKEGKRESYTDRQSESGRDRHKVGAGGRDREREGEGGGGGGRRGESIEAGRASTETITLVRARERVEATESARLISLPIESQSLLSIWPILLPDPLYKCVCVCVSAGRRSW